MFVSQRPPSRSQSYIRAAKSERYYVIEAILLVSERVFEIVVPLKVIWSIYEGFFSSCLLVFLSSCLLVFLSSCLLVFLSSCLLVSTYCCVSSLGSSSPTQTLLKSSQHPSPVTLFRFSRSSSFLSNSSNDPNAEILPSVEFCCISRSTCGV